MIPSHLEHHRHLFQSIIAGALAGFVVAFVVIQNPTLISQKGGVLKTNSKDSDSILNVQEESQTVDAVQKVLPSVVSIVVSKELVTYQRNPFFGSPFDFFFGDPFEQPQQNTQKEKRQIGGGSGFIVSSDGLIVTNKHVVSDESADYSIVMNDGKTYDAKILDSDPVLDLAVIKIDAKDLPAVELGDSEKIQIGQTVIAIGNALGEFQNSVTRGIVSGLGRTIVAGDRSGFSERLEEVIQTDAAISPGNSGGPLINLAGQVIGVNSAVSQQGENIGFAIPINEARRMVESVKEVGRIVRPYLGVRYMVLNKEVAQQNDLPVEYGALVVRGEQQTDLAVIPGSPADKAGIVENDIILELNGTRIDEKNGLARLIAQYKVGDVIKLKVMHKGSEKEVSVTLTERPR
ncbi:MAG TPA: trypsin-like peptidase domain-containing protein [Patescibacteria group bacterium]|nr:trypsin-like peptidase domain-containing protein [Patescibacteria group bacterium]